jgi:hypothetical protein
MHGSIDLIDQPVQSWHACVRAWHGPLGHLGLPHMHIHAIDCRSAAACSCLTCIASSLHGTLGHLCTRQYKGTAAQGRGWPNLRGAAARFLKSSFLFFFHYANRCWRKLSTIDITLLCYQFYLPLHHISLDRGGGVVGVLHVCISWRCRYLRRWIGSDHEEETASTTTSSTFYWTFSRCDFFKGMKISSISLIDYIS